MIDLVSDRYREICTWAEDNIILPRGTAYPGPLRLHKYQRGILEAYDDPSIQQVTLMLSSQIGKSTMALVMLAYEMETRRRPAMLAQPREADIKRFIHDKFEPMVASTPSLRESVATRRSSVGVYNNVNIDYRGGSITLAHAGSPASMRGFTGAMCLADEVDLYEATVDASNPISPVIQRMVTYGRDATMVVISTPTTAGHSLIEREYEKGDQRRFWVPCHACGAFQLLKWESVTLSTEGERRRPVATLHCVEERCGEPWTDAQRRAAVDAGEWRAEHPTEGHASFHLSQLYSPMVTMQQTADSYDPDAPRGFVTAVLAEPYNAVVSEEITPEQLESMMVDERPEGAVEAVTVGVDVQQNRLEYQLVEFLDDNRMHVSVHKILPRGYEDKEAVYEDLVHILARQRPDRMLIDRSYRPDEVRRGIHTHMRRWAAAGRVAECRGLSRDSFGESICPEKPSRGYYPVATDEAKMYLMDMVAVGKLTVSRSGVPADWLEQFTAERMERVVRSTGKEAVAWVQIGKRNEALDCAVYALAARFSLGFDYRRADAMSLGSVIGMSSKDQAPTGAGASSRSPGG